MNKQELARKLVENHREFADFIVGLDEGDFYFATAEKWTAGQQLEHIRRGVAPVAQALTLPKFVPRLLFGKSNRESIGYETLVTNYRKVLAEGAKAGGRFLPPPVKFENRAALKEKLLAAVAELNEKTERFSEAELDKYLLPHPLLGKLTIREMLYFTIYHARHHHDAAVRNLKK